MESRSNKIIFLLTALSILFSSCKNEIKHEPYRLNDGDKALLMSGDIIMRRGHGMLSTAIVGALNDSLGVSHCGIVVRRGDSIDVVHCLADEVSGTDGIQKCTIDDFTDESVPGTVSVVRYNGGSGECLANGALRYLEMGKKFDWEVDVKDTVEFFCSELPMRILNDSLGVGIINEKESHSFTQFFNPKYFRIVLRNR